MFDDKDCQGYVQIFAETMVTYQSCFYSPTDAQVNCLKNNFKIHIKTAPTCFGTVTP